MKQTCHVLLDHSISAHHHPLGGGEVGAPIVHNHGAEAKEQNPAVDECLFIQILSRFLAEGRLQENAWFGQ